MTILDLTILSFLGYNTFSGFRQGAIKMMSGLIGIGLGTLLSKPNNPRDLFRNPTKTKQNKITATTTTIIQPLHMMTSCRFRKRRRRRPGAHRKIQRKMRYYEGGLPNQSTAASEQKPNPTAHDTPKRKEIQDTNINHQPAAHGNDL